MRVIVKFTPKGFIEKLREFVIEFVTKHQDSDVHYMSCPNALSEEIFAVIMGDESEIDKALLPEWILNAETTDKEYEARMVKGEMVVIDDNRIALVRELPGAFLAKPIELDAREQMEKLERELRPKPKLRHIRITADSVEGLIEAVKKAQQGDFSELEKLSEEFRPEGEDNDEEDEI